MKQEIYEIRVKKLIEVLKEKEINGFLCGISDDMYYLLNFYSRQGERFFGLFIPSIGHPVLLAPEVECDNILETTWIDNVISWKDGEDPLKKMASIVKERKLSKSKIAVDDTFRSDFILDLQEKLPQVKFISGSKFVNILRQIKSNYEKELMMYIGNIHDRMIEKAISAIQIGVSELKIANVIRDTFKEYGATLASLNPIVASGPYSAQPHYFATEKVIVDGESVVIDCGGDWKHYKSDMTRTVFVGNPSEEYLKVYNIVRKAQELGVQSVRPGRTCEEIDRVCRKVIEDEGYGQYFIHRTGHGIGLTTHEEPYIVEGNKLVLEPGMTFSVEPGIYLPGKYGVRIEDCVIVTEKGAETFTKFTHNLITI